MIEGYLLDKFNEIKIQGDVFWPIEPVPEIVRMMLIDTAFIANFKFSMGFKFRKLFFEMGEKNNPIEKLLFT